jgi:O-acetyl-ADP-ribose deacetylase (regulator of RNase III)
MNQYRISLVRGDITLLSVDAIVNAANNSLLGGGGVDGAIHRAAGPGLLEECRQLHGCATGEAKITRGYLLPSKYVLHTVGPVWHGGIRHEEEILAHCYQSCFSLAREYHLRTIAFPSISTGAYGFPVEHASAIALKEIDSELSANRNLSEVAIVCFDEATYTTYSGNPVLSANRRSWNVRC